MAADDRATGIAIDVHDLCAPDLAVVDALARLHLAARRCGGSIRVVEISDSLRELLDLIGLADLLAPGCLRVLRS